MRIIGLDPGLATTGFGVIDFIDDSPSLIELGTINTAPQMDFAERLHSIGQDLQSIIDEFKPDYAAVESLFFAKNTKTAISVAHARGVLLFVLKKNLLDPKELTPLEVKNEICGYGQADKQQIQKMLSLEFNLNQSSYQDDAADALAVAICGARFFSRRF